MSGSDQAIDRRPIRSRGLAIWRGTTRLLVRAGVSANAVSVVGMLFGLAAGAALAATGRWPEWSGWLFVSAAALVQLRLICNMLDGMVAIESGRASPVGELFNEVPDRISDAATLIGLGYAAQSIPELGYIAAVLAVFVAYVRAAGKIAGAGQDYRGPMAKQQRMFLVTLAAFFQGLAPASWRPTLAVEGWSVPTGVLGLICVGCLLTAARRLWGAGRALKGAKP